MKEKKLGKADYFYWMIIPLMLVIGIVPLIVFMKSYSLTQDMVYFWTGVKDVADFFSYYKSVTLGWFTFIAIACLVTYLSIKGSKECKFNSLYIPLIIYIIFVFLSAIVSKYTNVAFSGFIDREEGFYMIFSYCFLMYYASVFAFNELRAKSIIYALTFCALVICGIGVFQYFGMDYYKSPFGKMSIVPTSFYPNLSNLKFQFGEKVIYSSLYHYNYVGSFVSITVPMFLVFSIFIKDMKYKIASIVMAALTAFVWLGCNARSGIIGVSCALIVLILLNLKRIHFKSKSFLYGLVAIVLIGGLGGFLAKDALFRRFEGSLGELKLISQNKNINLDNRSPIKNITADKNVMVFEFDNLILGARFNNDKDVRFFDKNSKEIQVQKNGDYYSLLNPEYKDIKVAAYNTNNTFMFGVFYKDANDLYFALKNNLATLIDKKGKAYNFEKIPSWGFKGAENFASARGYIWSRSIPMIKNTLILGNGPDTFSMFFPQQDIIGKQIAYGDMYILVDKPHNLYIQQAINTGLISLLAFLTLMIMYFVQSFKLYWSGNIDNNVKVIGMGCFLGVVGYLGAGLFNDSVVSVAPVFWIILGLGIAMNRLNKESNLETK